MQIIQLLKHAVRGQHCRQSVLVLFIFSGNASTDVNWFVGIFVQAAADWLDALASITQHNGLYVEWVHYVKCFVVFSVNWRGCLIVARGVVRLTLWSLVVSLFPYCTWVVWKVDWSGMIFSATYNQFWFVNVWKSVNFLMFSWTILCILNLKPILEPLRIGCLLVFSFV